MQDEGRSKLSDGDDGANGGAIAGIVIAVVVVIAVAAGSMVWWLRRHKAAQAGVETKKAAVHIDLVSATHAGSMVGIDLADGRASSGDDGAPQPPPQEAGGHAHKEEKV